MQNYVFQYLVICNAGLVTGLSEETLKQILDPVVTKYYLAMPPGKSYSFVEVSNETDAKRVYNEIHGRVKLPGEKTPLYLSFTKSGKKNLKHFLVCKKGNS